MAKRVTITDLAAALGMSKTTVSASITGKGRVSEATRERVLAAAAELGYRALPAARHLRDASTGAIGLYLPTRYSGYRYHMRFASGVAERARQDDLSTVLLALGEQGAIHKLAFPVDGIVVGDPQLDDPALAVLVDSGVPVVFGDGTLPGMPQPSGIVRSNHREVFLELLDSVVALGSRTPVMLTPTDLSDWGDTLRRGYLEWCAENRFEHRVCPVDIDSTPAAVRRSVEAFLDSHPEVDAIISSADIGTSAVLHWARDRERRIGEDLLLAQCTDSLSTTLSIPTITSIDLRPDALGAESADLLLSILAGDEPEGAVRELPLTLIRRESTSNPLSIARRSG